MSKHAKKLSKYDKISIFICEECGHLYQGREPIICEECGAFDISSFRVLTKKEQEIIKEGKPLENVTYNPEQTRKNSIDTLKKSKKQIKPQEFISEFKEEEIQKIEEI